MTLEKKFAILKMVERPLHNLGGKKMFQEIVYVYSEERGTWNLFVNGEWYYEGTYEECEQMYYNFLNSEEE